MLFFLFISPCTVLLLSESFCLFVLPYFRVLSSLLFLLLSAFGFLIIHATSPVTKRFLFQRHLFFWYIFIFSNSDTEHMYVNVCECQHFRFTAIDYLVLMLPKAAESGSPLQCSSYGSISPGSKRLSTYVWETYMFTYIYIHEHLYQYSCAGIYTYPYIYICVCVCLCVCICTPLSFRTLEAGLRFSVCLEACHRTPGLPNCWHTDTAALEAHSPALVTGVEVSHPVCHAVRIDAHQHSPVPTQNTSAST